MKRDEKRIERLKAYVQGVLDNEDGKTLYDKYREDIEAVTPQECFEIFTSKIERGYTPEDILTVLDKVINVFHKSLSSYSWERPKKNSFLDILIQENTALERRLNGIREIILNKQVEEKRDEILGIVKSLKEFNEHYLKKENILFPYMEKKHQIFNGLSIMWTLHDHARESINRVIDVLEADSFP